MAGGSGLKKLSRTDGISTEVETNILPFLGGQTEKPKRFTSFAPMPRGAVKPVVGTVSDPKGPRGLAQSSGGWVSREGQTVSYGYLYDEAALRTVPQTAAILDRLDTEKEAAEAARQKDKNELLTEYLDRGKTDDDFYEAAQEGELWDRLEQLAISSGVTTQN